MSTKPVGIKDVAAAAGVSIATVSQVLNNVAYARVGAETRDRVHEAAHRLGYGPNRLARALRTHRSGVVGVICQEIATTPNAAQVILGSLEAARVRGYTIMIINATGTGSDDSGEADVAALLDRHVDGIVYAATGRRRLRVPASLAGLPAVLVDADDIGHSVSTVITDEEGGARTAVQSLIDAGHTRIGMINCTDNLPRAHSRLRAFKDTLADAGLEFLAELVQSGPSPDAAGGYHAGLRLMRLDRRPTAVFCFNDLMAMGLYRAAAQLGVTIPDELSVIGFDNQELIAGNLHPALTSVALPHYEMGARAMEILINAIEGTPDPGPLTAPPTVLPCPLLVRASVAPPPPESSDQAVAPWA